MEIKSILKIILQAILKLFLVIAILVILLIGAVGIFLIYLHFTSYNIKTNDLKKYDKCIKSVKYPEYVQHFPKTISKNPDDAKLYCYTSDYHGEWVLLLIKANKDYINQELKSHKFINSEDKIGDYQEIYYMPSERVGIQNNTDLTYYVFDNAGNRHYYPKSFPLYNGIGVDRNLEHIFYYYVTPDD